MEYNEYPNILELKSLWDVIERYQSINDLLELKQVVDKDLAILRKNMTGNADSIYDMENLVKNFLWWMFYSDHITYPGSLDEDYMGRSFYPSFQEIYQKFINNVDGEETTGI